MKKGDTVIAIRDGSNFKEGTTAIVTKYECIDSEFYVFGLTIDGKIIGPSYEGYWEVKTL